MFWPMAIVTDSLSKKSYTLHTYEGSLNLESAKKVITDWKSNDRLQVLCAYITDSDTNQVVYLENNVDIFGKVHYANEQNNEINRTM